MHGQITSPSGLVLMAADTPEHMEWSPGSNMAVSLSGEDLDELTGYWDKLAEGATITVPLAKAPWGDTFGMLVDKFGVSWLVKHRHGAGGRDAAALRPRRAPVPGRSDNGPGPAPRLSSRAARGRSSVQHR